MYNEVGGGGVKRAAVRRNEDAGRMGDWDGEYEIGNGDTVFGNDSGIRVFTIAEVRIYTVPIGDSVSTVRKHCFFSSRK